MNIRGGWAWTLIIVLVLSLGANFFMGGIAFSKFGRGGGPWGGMFLSAGLEDLPHGLRHAVARHLRAHRQEFHDTMRDVRDVRRDAVELMLQPAPDYDKIRDKFAQVRTKTAGMQEKTQELILDMLRDMPADEREKLLARKR